jgi:hypothetical protein
MPGSSLPFVTLLHRGWGVRVMAVALLVGCVSAPVEPPAGHVILTKEHSPGSWISTETDVAPFESDLAVLFARPDGRFDKVKPDARLSEYSVRYFGRVRNGRREILGEGTHLSVSDFATFRQINSDPDTILLTTWGGGTLYFTAIYDPTAKKILSVAFNASL